MTRQQISNTADTDRWRLPDRLTVDGATVAAGVFGDGPPVVLVHGTPSSSYLWRAVIPRLAEQNTVYVWDLPGYGDSPPVPGEPVAIRTHARVLARLVEHWGLERPVLVGHDIGAATVLRAHLVEGVPVRRIALLDAAVLSPWVTPVAQHMQRHLDVYRTMPTHIFQRITEAHLDTATRRRLPSSVAEAYLGPFAGPSGQQRYLDQVQYFDERDTLEVVDKLGTVKVPVQILWGADDEWLDRSFADDLAGRIPGARATLVPGAGHFLTEDEPDLVAQALAEFLTKSEPFV
ncbi:pimeloyl-ACP methyl ester carboxylesterase [Rhodococcus percolatus]|uniref:alpha/beta fold hydrolase n=1 Tax=Rhodococcus opacus TaxID=37919 RepID=UPI0015F8ED21|nr:alpha/beta hydrolase [Rhodococcus opacus]MBA8961768.1 pimeloyl-ACP methyl ester carboxylesterase [Rhodococcus opacus]MBP2202368.1 pimeloyl-ACP methyl ester carboxylesterase [Rhodococcus opacus]